MSQLSLELNQQNILDYKKWTINIVLIQVLCSMTFDLYINEKESMYFEFLNFLKNEKNCSNEEIQVEFNLFKTFYTDNREIFINSNIYALTNIFEFLIRLYKRRSDEYKNIHCNSLIYQNFLNELDRINSIIFLYQYSDIKIEYNGDLEYKYIIFSYL